MPKIKARRVKGIAKEVVPSNIKFTSSAVEALTDITNEFIQFIALAGVDRSAKAGHYLDSKGVVQALNDLGFSRITAEMPEIPFPEDMTQA